MTSTHVTKEDEFFSEHHEQAPPLSESTPLLYRSINNPLQEKRERRQQKQVYSAITLSDIFLKIVNTTIVTSFLFFCYLYIHIPYEKALAAYYSFCFISWMLTAFFTFNLDLFKSKQKAIVIGFMIYMIGLAVLSAMSAYFLKMPKKLYFLCIIPLVLIGIGDGVCKSCITEFTHAQITQIGDGAERLNSYLIKLFWIGHTGAFFVVIFLLSVFEYTRFDLGYGLCCVCILAGLVTFTSAWNSYEDGNGSNRINIMNLISTIVKEAWERKKMNEQYGFNDSMASSTNPIRDWLDYAKHSYGGSTPDRIVNETKSFFRVCCLFVVFIPYWTCNAQNYSTFIFQGLHLDNTVRNFHVPVTWIALIHVAAVLLFAKLLDNVVYPYLRRRGSTFRTCWRIVVGMVFGIFAMVFAACLELYAHKHYQETNSTDVRQIGIVNVTYVSDVSVFWMVPQFVFLGISEVLVGLAGLGLAYKLCRGTYQKSVTSVYQLTIAFGHLISLIIIVTGWFPSGTMLESNKMMLFFGCMGVACFLSLILFLIIISKVNFYTPPPLGTYQTISQNENTAL